VVAGKDVTTSSLDTSKAAVTPAYIITIPTEKLDPKSTGLSKIDPTAKVDPLAKGGKDGLLKDPMALDKNSNSTGNGTDDTLLGDKGTAAIDDGSGGGGGDGCNCGGEAPLATPSMGGSKSGSKGTYPTTKGGPSKGFDTRAPM
jgi:hypothetical protein